MKPDKNDHDRLITVEAKVNVILAMITVSLTANVVGMVILFH